MSGVANEFFFYCFSFRLQPERSPDIDFPFRMWRCVSLMSMHESTPQSGKQILSCIPSNASTWWRELPFPLFFAVSFSAHFSVSPIPIKTREVPSRLREHEWHSSRISFRLSLPPSFTSSFFRAAILFFATLEASAKTKRIPSRNKETSLGAKRLDRSLLCPSSP